MLRLNSVVTGVQIGLGLGLKKRPNIFVERIKIQMGTFLDFGYAGCIAKVEQISSIINVELK